MRWVLRGAVLAALAFANLNTIWSPDVIPNALFSWTLLREGDVDYDEFVASNETAGIDRQTYFFRACGSLRDQPTAVLRLTPPRSVGGPPPPGPLDRVCSIFPPGVAVLALPVLAPFVLAGVPPDLGAVIELGHLAAAALETLAALLLWAVLRRLASARWALALVLLYWLGTSVRTVASQALWQHAGVHLALAAVLWLIVNERPPSRARELLAGALAGLGGVVRQTTILVAAGLAAGRRRAALAIALGSLVGGLPLLAFNLVVFGAPFEQGYGGKPFDPARIGEGLYGLLLSPSRGLLVYEPYVVLALVALALAWRREGHVAERLRGLGLAWLAALLLYASYAEWWGGRVFGPRFLDDQAPVLFVAMAWAVGAGALRRPLARALFGIAAAWSLLIFQAAAFVYDQRWDTEPRNVNFAPERLFEWSDPQWWAVLGGLAEHPARVFAAALLGVALVALLLLVERDRPKPVPRSSA